MNSLPSSGDPAPQNEEQVSPEQREFIDVTNDVSGENLHPLPDGHRRDSPAPSGPLRIPLSHSGPSSSSSSSVPPVRTRPDGARPTGDEKEAKYGFLQSPPSYKNDDGEKSTLERLIQALERGGINRRASGMDDLQVKMLANYQSFDPARHDISAWTAGFKRLVPDDASDEQVMRALECRLPRQYADLLKQARSESEVYTCGWREAVKLFLSRVSGSENRLAKLRKLKSLTQKDGEQIRQFAIRVRDELQRIHGKDPSDQEWRDKVMVGALDATAMELDRIANQMPGNPGFWEVIKAVEFWERQHAALLNQGDPLSAIRRSSAGAAVLLGDPGVAGKEPTVVCTWCSQRGHLESTCIRDPRCARCFGPHPERNHDAIVMDEQAYFLPRAVDGKRDMRASFSGSRGGDSRGPRDYTPRYSRGQSRPLQGAAGERRDNRSRMITERGGAFHVAQKGTYKETVLLQTQKGMETGGCRPKLM